MRPAAAAIVALAVALLLGGCGGAGAGRAQTITIELPSSQPAAALVATVSGGGARVVRVPAANHRVPARPTTTVLAPVPAAAIAPLTPAANARLDGVSVWVPYWSESSAVATALDNAGVVRVAHPFSDEITGDATIVDQSGGQAPALSSALAAGHLDVIPTVTETARMGAFARTLASARRWRALLRALVRIAEAPHNAGIDLDFENLALGTHDARAAAQVASLYPQLVGALCAILHRSGHSCEVTVMAKTNAGITDSDGLDTSVYDYAALGAVADRVQVMAYDDHYPGGAPGPIAPWPWVESVIGYALTQLPAAKLVLGIPAYGYDWSSRGGASSLTAGAAEQLAARVHAQVRWDPVAAEPYFHYSTGPRRHRVHHSVWFEDSTADDDRAVLAADDKLAGIALWAAGDEQPQLWPLLRRLR